LTGRVRTRWLLPLVGLLGAGLLLACVLWFPRLLYRPLTVQELDEAGLRGKERFEAISERLKLQNAASATLLQGLGGGVVLVGVFFTWRQLRGTQEGQITDRYTKAIDQLGKEKGLAVKVGGVYALERIARDSPRDRRAISEVLCAYVRTADRKTPDEEPGQALDRRAPDIQAAVTILGRWDRQVSSLSDEQWRDLHGADLRDVQLRDARLRGAYLFGAQLQRAQLHGADLQDAGLRDAKLDGAYFTGTQLQRARLGGAQLEGAKDLEKAALQGARATVHTRWPDGWDRRRAEQAGVQFVDEQGRPLP
jgi:Pentapeptide repeats (8 copies)